MNQNIDEMNKFEIEALIMKLADKAQDAWNYRPDLAPALELKIIELEQILLTY